MVVGEGVGRGDVAVVIVVAAKEVEFLVASAFHHVEDVVGNLASVGDGFLSDQRARIGRKTLVVLVLVPRRDEVGVAEIAVIEVAAHHKAMTFVIKFGCADEDGAFHIFILAGLAELIGDDVIIKGVADVAAHAPMEVLDAVVVDAQGTRKAVGHAELIARSRAVLHPIGVVEHVGIQGGNENGLITPFSKFSPKADARFVPSAGQDGEFALGTIASEKLGG